MKDYILQTESGFFISNNNEFNVTKQVSDIKLATKFNYNDAVSFSNIHYQVSNVKTKLINTKKKTPVQWLINELQSSPAFHGQFFKDEFKKALEMEKEQM
jgi:hypothetical protein